MGVWMRVGGGALALLLGALACSPDRTPRIPPDTPSCAATCEAAWPCGGVLGNDLTACQALCVDEEHGDYRVCIQNTACEEMHACKVYGPGEPVDDTDTDTDL